MEEKERIKRNVFFCFRALGFICLLAVLILTALYLLTPLQDYGAGSMIHLHTQQKNSIDVLSVGTSLTYAGINTNVLWHDWGMAAYNLAGAEQQYWSTYYWLMQALETQNPRLIVLDAKAATYPQEETRTGRIVQSIAGILNPRIRIQAICDMSPKQDWVDYMLLFPQIHEQWKKFTPDRFQALSWTGGRGESWKGYVEKNETEKHTKPTFVWTKTRKKIQIKEEKYFRKIIELAQSKQIPVLIVAYPNPDYENDHMYYNALWSIAQEYGVPHLNLNDPKGKYRFRYTSEFADWQHVNIKGGIRLTRALGEYISANYDIPDRRGDSRYSSWQTCLEEWIQTNHDYAEMILTPSL